MENIYTILQEIEYEDKIRNIMKMLNLKDDDEFLLQQGVYRIVQDFYENIIQKNSGSRG